MRSTRLGATGLTISRIALGCMSYGDPSWRPWVLDATDSMTFFRRAIEGGVNFVDTADMYSLGLSAPIIGAMKSAQRDDAIAAVELELGADKMTTLEAP